MQTFLPYPDFVASAGVLDRARLGKQRVEVLQILNVLVGPNQKAGWRNHPAVRMWRGYEPALCLYGTDVCREWTRRGYRDTCQEKINATLGALCRARGLGLFDPLELPPWVGDAAFNASHRGNLLRKDPVWYGRLGWAEPPDLPYVWPVPKEST